MSIVFDLCQFTLFWLVGGFVWYLLWCFIFDRLRKIQDGDY